MLRNMAEAHEVYQELLESHDSETRMAGYESLLALDNRAFALVTLQYGEFSPELWFDIVGKK